MAFKAIVFDLGKVLVKLELDQFYNNLFAHSNLTMDLETFIEDYTEVSSTYHEGRITDEEFFRLICTQYQVKGINQEDFFYIFNYVVIPDVIEEMVDFFKELVNLNKYKMLCLSNTNSNHIENGKKRWPFLRLFDELILSHQVHMIKPNPEIYKLTIEKAGCDPEEIVFIDDSPKNIEGAKEQGITSILFRDRDNLKEELRRLKVI